MKPYYDHHKGDFRRPSLFPLGLLYTYLPRIFSMRLGIVAYSRHLCLRPVPPILALPYIEEFIVAIKINDETRSIDTVVTMH